MKQQQTSTPSSADQQERFADYEAVERALQPYFDAAKSGDGALTRNAFYDHARIVGTVNGEFHAFSTADFEGVVNQSGPAPDIRHRIVSMEISQAVATAKVELINWGDFSFVDFFSLCKKNGEWKISGIVFDAQAQA